MKFKFENGDIVDFDIVVVKYLKEKIARNMAYKTIQAKSFNRFKYKLMIMRIIGMFIDGKSYVYIGKKVNRSSQRCRQLVYSFLRRTRWCIEHNNQTM